MIKLGIWKKVGKFDDEDVLERVGIGSLGKSKYWVILHSDFKRDIIVKRYLLTFSKYFKIKNNGDSLCLYEVEIFVDNLAEAKIKADEILRNLNINFIDSKYETMK